jgi:hypothetical protein
MEILTGFNWSELRQRDTQKLRFGNRVTREGLKRCIRMDELPGVRIIVLTITMDVFRPPRSIAPLTRSTRFTKLSLLMTVRRTIREA